MSLISCHNMPQRLSSLVQLTVLMMVMMMMTMTMLSEIPVSTYAAATSGNTSTTATTAVNVENEILHFSYELERWLDTDKRPCHDFYAYVCGKTLNNTQEQLEQRKQREQEKFDKFLRSDHDDELMDVELKLKQFYDSCKNARSMEDLKSSLMYRMSGGWPAIDDSALMIRKRRNMTWMNVLSAFHDVGLEYFFQQRIEIQSNKRVVYFQPDETTRYTLRRFEQLAGEVMQEYTVEAGRARLIALEILSFERNRRDILKSDSPQDQREFTYADFKATLFGNVRLIDWDAYFKKILGKTLKASDTLQVRNMPKLVQIFELLQNTTMTRLLNWIWIDYLMDKSSAHCQTMVQNYFGPVYRHIVDHAANDKVQMAQMYSDIGRTYDQLLSPSSWIDEISEQNSKQFLGRVIHVTLNGDAKLDSDYSTLMVTKRNFYRNLEKVQHFQAEQRKNQRPIVRVASNSVEISQSAAEFMKIFASINALLRQQNLTTPLNYVLAGEQFAKHMIASGSSSNTPGAWRSMDSEREFANFKQCIARQHTNATAVKYNTNDLLMKLLAQQQTLQALDEWLQKDAALKRRLNNLLSAGRTQMSLPKLYYIGTVLMECQQDGGGAAERKELIHSYLRNSREFAQAFACRVGNPLYTRNICRVL